MSIVDHSVKISFQIQLEMDIPFSVLMEGPQAVDGWLDDQNMGNSSWKHMEPKHPYYVMTSEGAFEFQVPEGMPDILISRIVLSAWQVQTKNLDIPDVVRVVDRKGKILPIGKTDRRLAPWARFEKCIPSARNMPVSIRSLFREFSETA